MNNIKGSQIASNGSKIVKSKNKNSKLIKKIRKESIFISFIVATLSAIIASYIFEHYLK